MNVIYNMAVSTMSGFIRLYSRFLRKKSSRKFSRFVKGQRGLTDAITAEMNSADRSRPTIWFHCASLGEYGIARPLIAEVKRRIPCNVVLTFFSPSGYEALEANRPDTIDHLFYLPLDTRRKASAFLDAVKPDRAVFMVSEYWPNYLEQLKFRAIPTFLISAIIRDNAPFFRWYGKTYRQALSAFTHIFVLNNRSRFNLKVLGYEDATVSGDALFDNASLVAATPWSDSIIERFAAGDQHVFAAGSISDYNDETLVAELSRRNPGLKMILVPHDLQPESIDRLKAIDPDHTICYTSCESDPTADPAAARILIMDCIGKLAYLYRYATIAYVGGGFTPLLHSVIEATVYGIPVSFGPRIERKVTPQQLVDLGIGAIVSTPDELCRWYEEFASSPQRLAAAREKAAAYVERNEGATSSIVNKITAGL